MYRTYDSAWNRTGYADVPQYSGQAALTDDYPAKCRCGSGMVGCGDTAWLNVITQYDIKPKIEAPDWVSAATGYVAWCRNGHEMKREAIA